MVHVYGDLLCVPRKETRHQVSLFREPREQVCQLEGGEGVKETVRNILVMINYKEPLHEKQQ